VYSSSPPRAMTRSHVPRTASVFGLITWDNDGHFQVFNPPVNKNDVKPQPGDIVVYEFSHTGIVSRKETQPTTSSPSKATPMTEADATATKWQNADGTTVRCVSSSRLVSDRSNEVFPQAQLGWNTMPRRPPLS